jgi:hypothetical protein
VGKNSFQESLDLSLTNFSKKKEDLGREKSLKRSRSEGIKLYKKCGQDPRNGLAGRTKVRTFESSKKSSKLEESVSSEERSGPSDQRPDNDEKA